MENATLAGNRSDPSPKPEVPHSNFLIVGLGASAGGLEAFFQFFDATPDLTGMAFVLVTHLNPNQESSLTELIQSHTKMKVLLARDGVTLAADQVYVIPPDALLAIKGQALRVTKLPADRRMPIDHFFNSLADVCGDKAVGIVLSGTGSDGTLGLRAIKEHGGLTIAQTPDSAKFDSMPQNAIATGYVDHVLNVTEMSGKLAEYAGFRARRDESNGAARGGIQVELEGHVAQIAALLQRTTGHDFTHYKKGTLFRRIERRMLVRRSASVAEYLEQLGQLPQEVIALFDDLLIGVTSFFRDPDAFTGLAANVIPRLFDNRKPHDIVRVWIPACSSGEEAYSLAILLHEYAASQQPGAQFQIFATDIEGRALETARRGRYPDGIANQVSPERLAQYFERSGSSYQVVKTIRDTCVFSPHDLIRDPPFSRLDLISCRNLLIYLEPELQKKLVPVFHYALRPGGYLFLGPSEDVPHENDLFVSVFERKHRIFQRRETLRRTVTELPLTVGQFPARAASVDYRPKPLHEAGLARILEHIVLDQCTSACVFIDDKGDVLYQAGNTDKYLQRPAGPPSNNVIEIARKGVRLDLRAAIAEVRRTKSLVVRQNISVETATGAQRINLIVRPAPEVGAAAGLYLIRFEELTTPATTGESKASSDEHSPDEPAMLSLENELKSTREKLEASVGDLEHANEDLRSSNEEVLSMNEELQSSNEELQTSKEELQSINEELETVNSELNGKVVALVKANNDTKNLFESTQLATIFLDKRLYIGKFTPAAKNLFNLIDSDISRPITDFAPRFIGANLVADAEQVLKSLTPIDRPVRSVDQQAWYIMRVLPYRTLEDTIEGVVITFHDVTALRKMQMQRDAIIESAQEAIIGATLEGIITTWNPAARRLYGHSAEEAIGRSISILVPPDRLEEQSGIFAQIRNGDVIQPFDSHNVTKSGVLLDVCVSISPILDDQGKILGASWIVFDISARKAAEEAQRASLILQESETRFRQIAELMPQINWTARADGVIDFVNSNWLQYTATAPDADHTRNWDAALFPEDAERARSAWRKCLNTGQRYDCELRLRRHDGEYRWHVARSTPFIGADGTIVRWFGTCTDIHDQKAAQEALLAADRQKDEFLAILGHELRNPLAPVRTAAQVLLRSLGIDSKLRLPCEIIQRQAMHMTRIIDDLLDISRISKGKIVLQKERVDLNVLALRTAEDYRPEFETSGATLSIEPAVESLWISADPTRICQVIGNLLHNAQKFMGDAGKVSVRLSRSVDGVWAEMQVCDTGIGMSAETIASIFEPFQQAHQSLSRSYGGLGLGLSMVKGIVEIHGGRVLATSKGLLQGSEFSILIPLERETRVATSSTLASVKSASRRILLVEDNVDSAEMIKMLLEMEGHRVEVAYTAANGLVAARTRLPNIVFCDIGLPGDMNGYSFARAFRADPALRARKLVALTGYGLPSDLKRATEAGFDLHLIKPIDAAALIELINSMDVSIKDT